MGEAITAALPRLLISGPRDLPGLLSLAADIAASAGMAADPPPALAELIAGSRLAVEARRLGQAHGLVPPYQAVREALHALPEHVGPADGEPDRSSVR